MRVKVTSDKVSGYPLDSVHVMDEPNAQWFVQHGYGEIIDDGPEPPPPTLESFENPEPPALPELPGQEGAN